MLFRSPAHRLLGSGSVSIAPCSGRWQFKSILSKLESIRVAETGGSLKMWNTYIRLPLGRFGSREVYGVKNRVYDVCDPYDSMLLRSPLYSVAPFFVGSHRTPHMALMLMTSIFSLVPSRGHPFLQTKHPPTNLIVRNSLATTTK